MHFSFLEKFGLSALIAAWVLYGANFLGGALVSVRHYTPAFKVAEATTTAGAAPAAAAVEADLGTLLAAATSAQGEKTFAKCKACHTVDKGGKNGVGPNLWNVVGGPKAHMEGFAYSSGLAAMHADKWTYENLDKFLASPKDYVAGTKMTFAGLKSGAERAGVIQYLRANAENPPPLPAPAPKPAQAAEATPAAAAPAAAAPAPAAAPVDFKALLAKADPAAGEKVFAKCKACHSVDNGGPNMVGPNLWNVVGAPIGKHPNFNYSAAMAGKGGEWTYEELNIYLTNPKAEVPGTKMTFAGLAKPEERANVIAFLRSKSDNPPPLP